MRLAQRLISALPHTFVVSDAQHLIRADVALLNLSD